MTLMEKKKTLGTIVNAPSEGRTVHRSMVRLSSQAPVWCTQNVLPLKPYIPLLTSYKGWGNPPDYGVLGYAHTAAGRQAVACGVCVCNGSS